MMVAIITVNIGGKERSLKFGTNSTARYCEVRGCTLDQYLKDMSFTNMRGDEIRDLIYSGVWAYDTTKEIKIDYSRFDVGDWIDEADQKEVNKIFQSLTDSNKQLTDVKTGDSKEVKKK